MYIIILKKLRFNQISCSRSRTLCYYGASKWYDIV